MTTLVVRVKEPEEIYSSLFTHDVTFHVFTSQHHEEMAAHNRDSHHTHVEGLYQ